MVTLPMISRWIGWMPGRRQRISESSRSLQVRFFLNYNGGLGLTFVHIDSELFDLVPPKHVMAGGLTMEDVQRRILQ